MRTKAVKERAIQKTNVLFDDAERVWDVLSYITAVETGRSFFADRRSFQILVLDNDTQVPFITSDQPIINIRADGGASVHRRRSSFTTHSAQRKRCSTWRIPLRPLASANPFLSMRRIATT
jgi:hypothetical protein